MHEVVRVQTVFSLNNLKRIYLINIYKLACWPTHPNHNTPLLNYKSQRLTPSSQPRMLLLYHFEALS